MAQDYKPSFEIPPEMRAFAERSVEQARQAFDTFITTAQRAVKTAEGQAATAQAGAKDIGNLAMGFAEKNIAASFEFAQKLLHAKDVEEVMKLQADYLKTQMQALADQAKDLGKNAAKMGGKSGPGA
jgi:phasin